MRGLSRAALAAAVVAAVAGLVYVKAADSPRAASHAASSSAAASGGSIRSDLMRPLEITQIRGFSMQLNGSASGPVEKYLTELSKTGANMVNLSLAAFQDNASSPAPQVVKGRTPDDQRLRELIDYAHRLDMRVSLMPIVLLSNPGESEWRGRIDPTKAGHTWQEWWDGYSAYILHYADLAQAAHVELFMVGSELISVEKQTENWERLIAQVRQRYHGLLTYSANWDHYDPVKYWDKLDLVGITSYYDLTEGEGKPTPETLQAAWRKIKADILAWRQGVGKPVLLTELSWPNQPTAAKEPWNYYASTTTDPALQKECFESFFKTWADEKALAGFLVWEWHSTETDANPAKDISYDPAGKPALTVIEQYIRRPPMMIRLDQPGTRPASAASAGSATSAGAAKAAP